MPHETPLTDRRQVLHRLALATALAPALPRLVMAQDAWPSRTITLVVPFPPGGQADLAARPIAEALQRILKATVIVENRQGAGGAVGNAAAAKAAPDGYTLLMTLSSLAVLPESQRLLGRPTSYEVDQLKPIARVLADPTLLAVPAKAPWKSVKDLVDDARSRPGMIPYGSSGTYGTLHVAMEMFAAAAGIKLLHVPYRGAGPALNDLLSGQIQALASAPGVLKQQVDAGNLRILANWGAQRIASFPETPTFIELGYKDVEFYIWAGVVAPAAVPPSVQHKLRAAVRAAVADPQFTGAMAKVSTPINYLDAPEFKDFWVTDAARLRSAVLKIGKAGAK